MARKKSSVVKIAKSRATSTLVRSVDLSDREFMGKVLLTFKVMPASANIPIEKIESEIKSKISADRMSREPIAFGLVAVIVSTLVEDAEGQVEKVESALRSIDGVGEVEVTEITRTI